MGVSVKQSTGASPPNARSECAGSSAETRRSDARRSSEPATQVAEARASDHSAIHQTLVDVFQGPSASEFAAQIEEPLYEPTDRLIIKQRGRVAAHLQLTHRTWCFGAARIPVAGVHWLCTLPEMRGCGHAHALLATADQRMRNDSVALGLLRTEIPHFYHRSQWAVCGRHSYTRSGARKILAQLSAQKSPSLIQQEKRLNIRHWRQMELAPLMCIYQDHARALYGPFERSEEHWRWLIGRRAYDQILVALDTNDAADEGREAEDEAGGTIVGYAITKGAQVLEMMTLADHPTAANQLLSRVCRDAIERDDHTVIYHGAPTDPTHDTLVMAGGSWHHHEACKREVFMTRLLDPVETLRHLEPELRARAASAGLKLPIELGVLVDSEKYLLSLSKDEMSVAAGRLGRSYIACTWPEFTRLALGHYDVEQVLDEGRLQASTQISEDLARVLLCRVPHWRPPLDDLPA
ncbi:MAG: GNAT family N-acetyltransferase [Pirellulales bacterium]|nr:GNAT family N-acetyltransferase [Pirellulales bacterium]